MSPIKWETLLADDFGRIDYGRVKSLTAIVLGVLGGLLAVAAGAVEVFAAREVHTDAVWISVGALVLPLTGGVVANGLQMRKQKQESDA